VRTSTGQKQNLGRRNGVGEISSSGYVSRAGSIRTMHIQDTSETSTRKSRSRCGRRRLRHIPIHGPDTQKGMGTDYPHETVNPQYRAVSQGRRLHERNGELLDYPQTCVQRSLCALWPSAPARYGRAGVPASITATARRRPFICARRRERQAIDGHKQLVEKPSDPRDQPVTTEIG